ncbi:transcription factor bHLH112-like protein [Tanacetum coccineum]
MAEEFQAAEVSWWNSPRTNFNGSPFMSNYAGGCWQNDFMNIKARSTDESCGGYTPTISPDSAFQITGSGSGSGSSPSTNTTWHQSLLVNGRNEESYNQQTLPEIILNNSSNFGMNQQENTSNFMTNSGDCTENLVTATSYGYPSSLLHTLFESASPPTAAAPQQQALYDFEANLNDFNSVPSMPTGFSSIVKPKQQVLGGLHLANKTPYWNAPVLDLNDNRAGFIGSTQPRFVSSTYEEKSNYPNMKSQNEEIRDLGSSVKKSSGEPTFKRPRLETPSPLPTFKVRKEKLGDRVTALQQLVSPFGKTDTASVLHEAIEYIKLLQDQVNVLSTPYMKNGATMQRQQIHDKVKDNTEGAKQDLKSRGLCLVPVSSTFPVTTETAPDYWTSSFGSTFK